MPSPSKRRREGSLPEFWSMGKADFELEIPGIDIISNGKESDTKQPQPISRVTGEKNSFNPRFSIWI
jgi:hypothetical protein